MELSLLVSRREKRLELGVWVRPAVFWQIFERVALVVLVRRVVGVRVEWALMWWERWVARGVIEARSWFYSSLRTSFLCGLHKGYSIFLKNAAISNELTRSSVLKSINLYMSWYSLYSRLLSSFTSSNSTNVIPFAAFVPTAKQRRFANAPSLQSSWTNLSEASPISD